MQAIILAAGKGTRMRPLTYEIPKPMLPVKGRPILEYILDALPESIDEVIMVTNYLGEQIKNHFGDKYGERKIVYCRHDALDGTGGAVHCAKNIVKGNFLVVNGDDLYLKRDLEKLCAEELAVLGWEVNDPSQYGVIETDAQGYLVDIIEKPENSKFNLINTGAMALTRDFFAYDLVRITDTEFGLPQTLAVMAKDKKVKVIPATRWMSVGCPEDLGKAVGEIEKFSDVKL